MLELKRFVRFQLLLFFIASDTFSMEVKSKCLDQSASCPLFEDLCEQTTTLHDICPVTCRRCREDPCMETNGGCSQLCNWKDGIVTCSCTPGFRLSDDSRTCEDINECEDGPNPCIDGVSRFCVNSVGSFSCQRADCQTDNRGTMNYYRSSSCCSLRNATCGINQSIRQALDVSENTTRRITFGNDASTASWPWMVQLTNKWNHLCGGSLLTPSWVVTSSDCVESIPTEDLNATLGHVRNVINVFLNSERREQRGIAEVIRHPSKLVKGNEENNIALLRLSSPVHFSDVISPICLPCGDVPEKGDKCWTTGFGALGEDPALALPEILQEVDVPIVGIEDCINAFDDPTTGITVIRDKMICAGYEQGGKDSCIGDSGGPLMCQRRDSCQWYLTGITSFGKGCGRKGFYGIYTNVFRFEEWIRSTLGEDAKDLCEKNFNPCHLLENEDLGCSSNPDACKDSNKGGCALTCCQRENGRESNCFDDLKFTTACQLYGEQCMNPDLQSFLEVHCPRTCKVC